jgi:hypothetical protein
MTHPLIGEAMRKAPVVWVAPGEPDDRGAADTRGRGAVDAAPRLLWCLPDGEALWVVTGPGEQQAPGLAAAGRARVTLRGDHGGRVVTWPAEVSRAEPGSEQWDQIVPQLAAKRLNAPGDAASLAARWAAECAVLRLAPAGEPLEAGPTLPDDRRAEPPRDSPVRRRTRRPFHLHRVRR